MTKGKEMRDTDLAYMAGIVDGEGSINLIKASSRHRHPAGEIYAQLGVTNTNEWVIRWFQYTFGGSINKDKKGCYRWNVTHRKAAKILRVLLPYLRIKKPQAELAILFQSRKISSKHMSAGARVIEEADRIRIKHLNTIGDLDTTST